MLMLKTTERCDGALSVCRLCDVMCCVCTERRPDKHDHVNPNDHPPMNDASDTQDNKPGNTTITTPITTTPLLLLTTRVN